VRVNQIRVSRNVKFFADRMMQKFNLQPLTDMTQPVVMYGIYNGSDYEFFKIFEPFIIALWRGTDALVTNEKKAAVILAKKNCKHYAASLKVQASLARWGIRAEVLPITSTSLNIQCEPRGNFVYCYISSKHPVMYAKYRMSILRKLEKSLPYKFIYTTLHKYSSKDLLAIYKKCFVGVRLLDHDGMSNSILEMGLMGRRTISNSGLPYTIRWKNMKGIRQAIIKQYKARYQENKYISDAYCKLIDIGEGWLEI
jgi:hypothetical protein